MSDFTTKAGTVLPIDAIKGKPYLKVAYRIQWFTEENPGYCIDVAFPLLTEDETIARATITTHDLNGTFLRKVTATKRETKKDFSDHTEKAETSAIGRALAMLGYGTQFALSDLDEGDRLADSPLAGKEAPVAPIKTVVESKTTTRVHTAQPKKEDFI